MVCLTKMVSEKWFPHGSDILAELAFSSLWLTFWQVRMEILGGRHVGGGYNKFLLSWWWIASMALIALMANKPRIRNFPRISNKESETKIRESETKIPRIRNQKPRESETKVQESDTKPRESETENQKLKIANQTPRSANQKPNKPTNQKPKKTNLKPNLPPPWTLCWMRYYRQLILIRDQTRHPFWTQCWKGYCMYLFFS